MILHFVAVYLKGHPPEKICMGEAPAIDVGTNTVAIRSMDGTVDQYMRENVLKTHMYQQEVEVPNESTVSESEGAESPEVGGGEDTEDAQKKTDKGRRKVN